MPTQAELTRLLANSNESLTLEYKSWLDLNVNHGKATLAKAAIALANEGGGIIILGMRDAENSPLASQARPAGQARYSQDQVNSAINRYTDPEMHCELIFALHPGSGVEHAFVAIPGRMTVPVMSTRDCQGVIMSRRCYIRKPGPRSEEPHTAEEWRGLLERCVRARRQDMLDAIRVIVQGHSPSVRAGQNGDLQRFCKRAKAEWLRVIEPLPPHDPARMPLGFYSLAFQIKDVAAAATFRQLQERMKTAGRLRHTGWGPFVMLSRQDLAPNIVDDTIQVWLGDPTAERLDRAPSHCDFWRADRSGFLYLHRGFDEDASDQVAPGSALGITLPIWRVGEALLYIARLARIFGNDPLIRVRAVYTGLRNRELVSLREDDFNLIERHRSCDNEVTLETEAASSEIEDNLVEILHAFLLPLYERFHFFELRQELVAHEVAKLRRGQF